MAHRLNPNINRLTQELSLAQPILFYGLKSRDRDALSPEKFIREIEAKQTKYNWSDAETLPYIVSCLRGEAADWWTASLENDDAADSPTGPTRNYKAFLKAFKEHYFLGGRTHRLNWRQTIVQQQGEDTITYLQRAMKELSTFIKENAHRALPGFSKDSPVGLATTFTDLERKLSDAANQALSDDQLNAAIRSSYAACLQENDAKLLVPNEDLLVSTAIREIRRLQRETNVLLTGELDGILEGFAANTQARHERHTIQFWISELVFDGLANRDIRLYARDLLDKKANGSSTESLRTITDLVGRFASSRNSNGNSKTSNHVHATETTEATEEAVAAAGRKQQTTNNNKPRRNLPTTPGAICGFCKKRGHTEQQCQKKKNITKDKTKVAEANVAEQSAPPPPAPQPQETVSISTSGNDCWS